MKAVLVTGSSSGIGRSVVNLLQESGFYVIATARNIEDIKDLASENIRVEELDVVNFETCRKTFSKLADEALSLYAIVNNAGYAQPGVIESLDPQDIEKQLEVNFIGAHNIIRASLPLLKKTRGSIIVQISSIAGRIPIPCLGAYCASKAALEAYSEVLKMELAPFGVHVVLIAPGSTRTKFNEKVREIVIEMKNSSDKAYKSIYDITLNDFGVPGDVSPETVAKTVVEALKKEAPRFYRLVRYKDKIVIFLRKYLPQAWFFYIMQSRFRIQKKTHKKLI